MRINSKVRESQFELLRIVAQWLIVFFHLFFDYTIPFQKEYPIYLGIQIPLHIGVIVFVLISGYFGIRPSIKGALKLVSLILFYFIPLAVFFDLYYHAGMLRLIKDFLIFSYPRYWFFRCYFFLYLFSPIINQYLMGISKRQRFYLIAILSFISIWIGTSQGDISLSSGKNLVNFLLIYVLGNTLRYYQSFWEKYPIKSYIGVYISFNVVLLLVWFMFSDSILGKIIMIISYPYCSPILYFNAILIFIIFGKLKIQSKKINYIATSVFAVYLIHYHRYIWEFIGYGAKLLLVSFNYSPCLIIPVFAVYASLIFIFAILIDKLLNPVWSWIDEKCFALEMYIDGKIK